MMQRRNTAGETLADIEAQDVLTTGSDATLRGRNARDRHGLMNEIIEAKPIQKFPWDLDCEGWTADRIEEWFRAKLYEARIGTDVLHSSVPRTLAGLEHSRLLIERMMQSDDADTVNLIKLRMQIDARMETQWNVFRRVWQQRVKAFSGFQTTDTQDTGDMFGDLEAKVIKDDLHG